jgi:Flp pilus assembly pilin Flp
MGSLGVSIARLRVFDRGQTMAEYALILVTVAVIAAALVESAGTIVKALVVNVSTLL